MTHKHITRTIFLLLAALLIIAPAAAADTTAANEHKILAYHPLGYSLADIKATVADIIADNSYTPAEKFDLQVRAFGFDDRLKAWLETPRNEKTGEIEYGTYIPVVTPVLSFFGLVKEPPTEPYSEDEGRKAWNEYHKTALENYKPTGKFPGAE